MYVILRLLGYKFALEFARARQYASQDRNVRVGEDVDCQ